MGGSWAKKKRSVTFAPPQLAAGKDAVRGGPGEREGRLCLPGLAASNLAAATPARRSRSSVSSSVKWGCNTASAPQLANAQKALAQCLAGSTPPELSAAAVFPVRCHGHEWPVPAWWRGGSGRAGQKTGRGSCCCATPASPIASLCPRLHVGKMGFYPLSGLVRIEGASEYWGWGWPGLSRPPPPKPTLTLRRVL